MLLLQRRLLKTHNMECDLFSLLQCHASMPSLLELLSKVPPQRSLVLIEINGFHHLEYEH